MIVVTLTFGYIHNLLSYLKEQGHCSGIETLHNITHPSWTIWVDRLYSVKIFMVFENTCDIQKNTMHSSES